MRNLLVGVRSGRERPAYVSVEARQADIEHGAGMRADELMVDWPTPRWPCAPSPDSCPMRGGSVPVRILDSAPFPADQVLIRRLVEVELHHCDLGAGYSPADWPAAFADLDLAEPMRSQRADRLTSTRKAEPLAPVRPSAPYRPNQRLPGSWLGTR